MSRTFVIEESRFPDLPQLMLATVEALKTLGGSASIDELDETIIEREGVTEEEQAFTMPNDTRPKLRYYLAWSRTYLKRGGALENSARSVWTLTEAGAKVTTRKQTDAIRAKVNAEEGERSKQKRKQRKEAARKNDQPKLDVNDPGAGDDELSSWKTRLLETLRALEPIAFERLSQRLLREAGFVKVEVRGQTGDGGIDGVGVLRVNLVSFQVYFQCKRWKGSVGAREIRDFRGALQGRADKGLFITTGTFTSQASEEATRDGAVAIDLIDGDRLCGLLKQYELGVKTQMIEKVDISQEWFAGV